MYEPTGDGEEAATAAAAAERDGAASIRLHRGRSTPQLVVYGRKAADGSERYVAQVLTAAAQCAYT